MTEQEQKLRQQLLKLKSSPKRGGVPELEIIAGLFPRGYMSIIASPPGVGKTWISEYIACQLTCGGTILNGTEINAKERTVLFMSGETGIEILSRRLGQTTWPYNPDKFICYSALEMGVANIPYLLSTPEGRYTFYSLCDTIKPHILWIDTLISYNGADESNQKEMTAIYIFLNKLARHYKLAVVVNHHTRKQPTKRIGISYKLGQDDVIGSGAGIRLAYSVYMLEKVGTLGDELLGNKRYKISMRQVKQWDREIEPINFEFINYGNTVDFLIDRGENFPPTVKNRLLKIITEASWGTYLDIDILSEQLGESRNNIRYHLDKIVANYPFLTKEKLLGKSMYKVISFSTEKTTEEINAISSAEELIQTEIPYI